jgi:alanine racemase
MHSEESCKSDINEAFIANPNPLMRDTVIKIDVSAIRHNMDIIKKLAGPGTAVMPVLKANAYGHGALVLAPVFMECGAKYLAVATLTEALELRAAYPNFPIFILGHTPARLSDTVVMGSFTQTVIDYQQAEALSEAAVRLGSSVKVHIKAETGLYRLGMTDIDEMLKIFDLPGLIVEGIFSHLALSSPEEDRIQLDKFLEFCRQIESSGHKLKYRHIADSVATVDKPEFRLDMIRPGSLCYGMHSWETDTELDVRQALRFETKISQVHRVKAGQGVSYGYKWHAPSPDGALIATVPFGYCDGYPRRLYEKGYVTVKGVKCPFCGLIGMDQSMVDVSDVPDVKQGDTVIIYGMGNGDGMSLQEAADLCATFKNDIIARLMARPPRIYTE